MGVMWPNEHREVVEIRLYLLRVTRVLFHCTSYVIYTNIPAPLLYLLLTTAHPSSILSHTLSLSPCVVRVFEEKNIRVAVS